MGDQQVEAGGDLRPALRELGAARQVEGPAAEFGLPGAPPGLQARQREARILEVVDVGAEQRARLLGLDSIFVLTTRTMHWFLKRGFKPVDPEWLPEARKRKYNWDRRSQVLVRKL